MKSRSTAEWQDGYKRQMEVYQWLFRKNGFKVSKTGYFVYCNGSTEGEVFDGKLEFNIKLLPYKGEDKWVEGTIPKAWKECDYCEYVEERGRVE
jgi:hypothetical protein